jgi:sugar lactone lactonase YvrE
VLAGCLASCAGCERPPEPPVPVGDLLVTGQYFAHTLLVHEGRLYWPATDGSDSIRSAPVTGGSAQELARVWAVSDLVVADEWLYACAGDVHRVALDGSEPEVFVDIEPAPAFGDCQNVDVDGDAIYWTNLDLTEGQIGRTELATGVSTVLADRQAQPTAVEVDAEYVYWNSAMPNAGGVFRVPKEGGEPLQLLYPESWYDPQFEWQPQAWFMAQDAARLYLALSSLGGDRGIILSVSKEGGDPIFLARDIEDPFDLAVDETHVYWTHNRDNNWVAGDGAEDIAGAVLRIPKEGGEVEVLAPHQNGPSSIALDGEYVYWTNWASGNIRRLRKPDP